MAEKRYALIIASWDYTADAGLRKLIAPPQDAAALARMLQDPAIGGFEVRTLLNEPSPKVAEEIEAFFAERQRDDLALLYFSGHGVKDTDGQLYFAMPNTRLNRLRSTSIKAHDVNEIMRGSRAQQKVLLLDCCYSGAFAKGMTVKADPSIGTRDYFEGRGLAILTASDALQYSFEEEKVEGQGVQSVFTRVLTQGLDKGEADTNGDGLVTFDEMYDYILDRIEQEAPQQKPRKWALDVQGKIVIARNPRPVVKPAQLPAELQQTIEDPRPWVREGAVRELGRLLEGSHPGLALAAQETLKRLAEDDSRRVASSAAEILAAYMEAQRNKKKEAEQQEQERLAREQAEAERLAIEKAERQRLATLKAEEERLAREKAEAERIAREKSAQKRAAREKAEQERLAREKAEEERLVQEKAEAESLVAEKKVEEERLAREKAEAERIAARKAEEERIAREKAEQERLARKKAEDERAAREKAEQEQLTQVKAETEYRAREKAEAEKQQADGQIQTARRLSFHSRIILAIVVPAGLIVAVLAPAYVCLWITSNPNATQANAPTATQPSPTQVSEKDGIVPVYVPAGEFLMGSADSDSLAGSDEKPQHMVYLDAFWIDKTEVTNAMYALCVTAGACQPPGDTRSYTRDNYFGNSQYADYPVIYVSWNDAQAYCQWAGRRLPTEAEWEKAARGTDGRKYPWGNQDVAGNLLNFADRNVSFDQADKTIDDGYGDTAPVGSYPAGASPYSALDMAGNVWEWVNDWYDETYYSSSPAENPPGPSSGQYRVLRGGSWDYAARYVRAAYREGYDPDVRDSGGGFRCAR